MEVLSQCSLNQAFEQMKNRYIQSTEEPICNSSCSSSLVIRTKIYLITRQKSAFVIKIEEYQIVDKFYRGMIMP